MKRKILVVFFTFLFFGSAQSQNTGVLKVEYNEYIIFFPSIVNKHKGILYASNDVVFYKTIYWIDKNKESNKESNKEKIEESEGSEESVFVINRKDNHKYFSEVVTNRKTKELVEHLYEHRAIHDYFSVYEKQPEMKWELSEDERKINDYNCKKATTTFRGRSYEVWYTPDIPVSVGPWKFSGLPGLILSVKDTTDEYYTWVVSSVTYPYKGNEIDFSEVTFDKTNFTKISYQDFDTKFFKYMEERTKRARSKNGREGYRLGFEYSTFQHKEPMNEWRAQTDFEF